MEDQDNWINEISDHLIKGKIVFLVGAGISVNRQSWLPLWTELIEEILTAVAGENNKEDVRHVMQYRGQLLNEAILQIMCETIGKGKTSELLDKCLNTEQFSSTHQFFAWGIHNFDCIVLTPNYDELIEHALLSNIKKFKDRSDYKKIDNVIKLHGTISRINEARFYIDSVFVPIEKMIADRVIESLDKRMLVVIGYRGADEFDVIPLIFEKCKPEKILWISRINSDKDSSIDSSVEQLLKKSGASHISTDVDELLEKIYQKTISASYQFENECRLSVSPKIPTEKRGKNEKDWWKVNFEIWKQGMWEENPSGVKLLWARILEHVRVYDDGKRNNLVKNAYEQFLESQPNSPILEVDTKAHIAYSLRTTNVYDFPKFQKVIEEIEIELNRETRIAPRKKLNEIYAWTIHEYGIALQNSKKYFQANLLFEKAATIRILNGDPQLAYTIFQQFMNGYVGKVITGNVDTFAPRGWRNWLLNELEEYSKAFNESNQVYHYSTTQHNMGFIYQYLAGESLENKKYQEADRLFSSAIERYNEGFRIRNKIQDPRRISQSIVRIAECKLGKAKILLIFNQKKEAAAVADDCINLAVQVKKIYSRIPQESLRIKDVENIVSEANVIMQQVKPDL